MNQIHLLWMFFYNFRNFWLHSCFTSDPLVVYKFQTIFTSILINCFMCINSQKIRTWKRIQLFTQLNSYKLNNFQCFQFSTILLNFYSHEEYSIQNLLKHISIVIQYISDIQQKNCRVWVTFWKIHFLSFKFNKHYFCYIKYCFFKTSRA